MKILDRLSRRKLATAGLGVVVLAAGVLVAAPWLARLPAVQRRIAARANAILAPSSVSFEAVRFAWLGPTEIDHPILRDAQGTVMVDAPRAVFTWTLLDIGLGRIGPATLKLPSAKLDLERAADGTINLYETLRPVLSDHPRWPLTIDVRAGRLQFADASWDAPFEADRADVLLDLGHGWSPIAWTIGLGRSGPEADRIAIEGRFSRSEYDDQGRHDVRLNVSSPGWPLWRGAAAGGRIDAERLAGRWRIDANLAFLGLTPGDLGKQPVLAKLALAGGDPGWTAEGIEIGSPWGSLKGNGRLEHAGGRSTIGLDLVAASSAAGRAPAAVKLAADVVHKAGLWTIGLDLKAATNAPDENLAVNGQAVYDLAAERLTLKTLEILAPYVRIEGSGSIDHAQTAKVDLKGLIDPDWDALTQRLAARIEPGARIAGGPRPWRLAGPLTRPWSASSLDGLEGEIGARVQELDVFGLKLARTDLVARLANGRVAIDPIEARLNGGRLHLEPEVVQEKTGDWSVRLTESSYLDRAAVNEDVSHRVLAYVAPVLEGATRVEGQVSFRTKDARFPIGGSKPPMAVEGNLLFHELRFLPGPLAADLFRLFRSEPRPLLVLRDTLQVQVSDRSVRQQGLKIPMGDLASVGLEGEVGFDRSLDLLASLAIEPRPGRPLPMGAKLSIPIKGTLDQPRIDTTAMQDKLKSFGADLLENGLSIGIGGLGRLLEGLPDRPFEGLFRGRPGVPGPDLRPASPPGETAQERRRLREERRQERLEKKAQKRQERPAPAPPAPAPPGEPREDEE